MMMYPSSSACRADSVSLCSKMLTETGTPRACAPVSALAQAPAARWDVSQDADHKLRPSRAKCTRGSRTCLAEQEVALEGEQVLASPELAQQGGQQVRIHNAHSLQHHPLQVPNLPRGKRCHQGCMAPGMREPSFCGSRTEAPKN